MRIALLLLVLLTQVGCATIFTGTRQDVSMTSIPPGSTVVVVSGTPATLALKAKKVSDFKDSLIGIFGGALPPEARAFLLSLSTDELITQLVLWTRAADAPPELVAGVGQINQVLSVVPGFVKDKISDFLGIAAIGTTPFTQNLHKGKEYAIVTWQKGHRARLLEVSTKFNWVTLLNVFVGIVPVVVDLISGSWLNLTPTEVSYTLDPLPPGAQPIIPTPIPAPPQ